MVRPATIECDARRQGKAVAGSDERSYFGSNCKHSGRRIHRLCIHTEAETIEAWRVNVREAVDCYFEETADAPKIIRLQLVREEGLAR